MADKNNNNDNQPPSTVTIPFEHLKLKADHFSLSDTTPIHVDAAHGTINLPCKNDNNNYPKTGFKSYLRIPEKEYSFSEDYTIAIIFIITIINQIVSQSIMIIAVYDEMLQNIKGNTGLLL
jgi:hypothetical protein